MNNTFRQALAECTSEQLEQIYHLWGMDGLPSKGKNFKSRQDVLLLRIKDSIAARFVWEYISEDERDILYRTLGHSARSGTRREVILQKSQLSLERFDTALNNLKQNLLLKENTVQIRTQQAVSKGKIVSKLEDAVLLYPYMESADALYTGGKEVFGPNSDRSRMTLNKILTSFLQSELSAVANHYSLSRDRYYAVAELRSVIEEELSDPNSAFDVLEQLDAPLRDLFKWLCEQGGKVSMSAVRRHMGYSDTELLLTLHKLEEFAIAFDTFSGQERVLFVPTTVYESLKKASTMSAPEAVPTGLMTLPTPPQAIQTNDAPMVCDMAIIIGAVYQQNIEPTQAGKVPKRLAAKIQPLLHGRPRMTYYGEDDQYMEMLFDIAQELGLIRLSKAVLEGIKPRYEPGPQLEQWSRMDAVDQTRRLLQCWVNSFKWRDILGINFKQWDIPYYWKPMLARGSTLEQLQNCTPGKWYSVASLLQTIWDKDPFELRPVQYNIRPADRRKTSALRAKWNSCEGEVYIGELSSTLYELGVVALGYEQRSTVPTEDNHVNPDAFMITEVGAAALAGLSAPSSTRSITASMSASMMNGNRPLVLQPNFELLLLHPDMPTLYSLLPFAQVNQVEMVSRLTLTRASVLRGMEAGHNIEEILSVLQERSQKEIPQNVAYTLRDWVKLYKDARVSQVYMLEVSSEAVTDEICSSSKLQKFNLRKLGPRVLIASNDINLQELRRTLDKEGIVVRVSGDIVTPQNRYSYAVTSGTPQ